MSDAGSCSAYYENKSAERRPARRQVTSKLESLLLQNCDEGRSCSNEDFCEQTIVLTAAKLVYVLLSNSLFFVQIIIFNNEEAS